MSTSDPSLVDSLTLLKSLERDIQNALDNLMNERINTAAGWLCEARATVAELKRREERISG